MRSQGRPEDYIKIKSTSISKYHQSKFLEYAILWSTQPTCAPHCRKQMHDLKMQIGQLANLVSQLQSAGSRNLLSQTIPNPKGGNLHCDRNRTHLILNLNQKPTPEFSNRLEPPYYRFPPGHYEQRSLKLMKTY
ncbi:hypothetical protein CR513_14314, partial [Mucuna pruriens]